MYACMPVCVCIYKNVACCLTLFPGTWMKGQQNQELSLFLQDSNSIPMNYFNFLSYVLPSCSFKHLYLTIISHLLFL